MDIETYNKEHITRTWRIERGLAGKLMYCATSLDMTQSALLNEIIRETLTLEKYKQLKLEKEHRVD